MRAARSKVALYIYIMSFQRIAAESAKHSTTYVIGSWRNVLLGMGLSYAVEREEYTHIPLIILFPSIYSGYHAYRNKDAFIDWLIETKKKVKAKWL